MDGPPQDETEGRSERRSIRRVLLRRAILLAITAVGFYVVWPALLDVFSAWPRLLTLDPAWVWLAVLAELGSFAVLWELQRIALRSDGWFLVVTSQLAGNAFSRIVPGGAPAGAALQYRMLTVGGLDGASTAVGLTTVSLLTTATTFALPVLSVPAIVSGIPVDEKLSNAAWLGLAIFVVLFAVGVTMFRWDAPLRWVGSAVEPLGSPLAVRAPEERDALGGDRMRVASDASPGAALGVPEVALELVRLTGAFRQHPSEENVVSSITRVLEKPLPDIHVIAADALRDAAARANALQVVDARPSWRDRARDVELCQAERGLDARRGGKVRKERKLRRIRGSGKTACSQPHESV